MAQNILPLYIQVYVACPQNNRNKKNEVGMQTPLVMYIVQVNPADANGTQM